MASSNQVSRPEHMLPIMIVLGIMFIGICIALNLFSRARFKKRSNVFTASGPTRAAAAAAASAATNRRPYRAGPGGSVQRLGSCCPSPMPQALQQDLLNGSGVVVGSAGGGGGGSGGVTNSAHYKQQTAQLCGAQSVVDESGRTSVLGLHQR